ncbi:MAG: hypothetical protein ABIS27_09590 [Longimicrobiales bacterium]
MQFAIKFGMTLALIGTFLNLYKWRRARDRTDLLSAIGTILILIALWMMVLVYRNGFVVGMLLAGIGITGWSVYRSFARIVKSR